MQSILFCAAVDRFAYVVGHIWIAVNENKNPLESDNLVEQ